MSMHFNPKNVLEQIAAIKKTQFLPESGFVRAGRRPWRPLKFKAAAGE